eukprot:5642363-Amphidinium_carterae.1
MKRVPGQVDFTMRLAHAEMIDGVETAKAVESLMKGRFQHYLLPLGDETCPLKVPCCFDGEILRCSTDPAMGVLRLHLCSALHDTIAGVVGAPPTLPHENSTGVVGAHASVHITHPSAAADSATSIATDAAAQPAVPLAQQHTAPDSPTDPVEPVTKKIKVSSLDGQIQAVVDDFVVRALEFSAVHATSATVIYKELEIHLARKGIPHTRAGRSYLATLFAEGLFCMFLAGVAERCCCCLMSAVVEAKPRWMRNRRYAS